MITLQFFVESFNGKLRNDCSNREWFKDLIEIVFQANIATTVATGTRRPRTHGMPPMTAGSTVILVKAMGEA